jgi:uncharacterized membrane protein SirB2
MMLAEFYPLIKTVHIALVAASGLLFALRGAAVLAGQAWPLRPWLRALSVAIDTALLTAGVTLWALLSLQPIRDAWLGTKLLLLLLYIVLGTLALKRARTPRGRALAFTAALACYLFMVSVALAHHPLGLLRSAPG